MAEMSMNKVIHAAVRRDLDRFINALRTFPAGDVARATQLRTAWLNFDHQLTFHHEGEHEIAWPVMRNLGVSDELLTTLDAEHEQMAQALTETGKAMNALARTASSDDAKNALSAFEHLQQVTTNHLDHEERETESVYLDNVDSPEIKEMGRKFGKVSPKQGGQFFAWVLDGASPEEKAAATHSIPGPVLTIIGGIFGRNYRKNIATVWR